MIPAQYMSFVVIICALGVDLWWIYTHKSKWLIAVPEMMWLLHGLIFYLVWWITEPENIMVHYSWGAALRLHGFLTALMMGLFRMKGRFTR